MRKGLSTVGWVLLLVILGGLGYTYTVGEVPSGYEITGIMSASACAEMNCPVYVDYCTFVYYNPNTQSCTKAKASMGVPAYESGEALPVDSYYCSQGYYRCIAKWERKDEPCDDPCSVPGEFKCKNNDIWLCSSDNCWGLVKECDSNEECQISPDGKIAECKSITPQGDCYYSAEDKWYDAGDLVKAFCDDGYYWMCWSTGEIATCMQESTYNECNPDLYDRACITPCVTQGGYCTSTFSCCEGLECINNMCRYPVTTTTPSGCASWCERTFNEMPPIGEPQPSTGPYWTCCIQRELCGGCSFCEDYSCEEKTCEFEGKTYQGNDELIKKFCADGTIIICRDGSIMTISKKQNEKLFCEHCPEACEDCSVQSESCCEAITCIPKKMCCDITDEAGNKLICEPPHNGVCQFENIYCLSEGKNCNPNEDVTVGDMVLDGRCCVGLKCLPKLTWHTCQKVRDCQAEQDSCVAQAKAKNDNFQEIKCMTYNRLMCELANIKKEHGYMAWLLVLFMIAIIILQISK